VSFFVVSKGGSGRSRELLFLFGNSVAMEMLE
jgi:hypothetical protein